MDRVDIAIVGGGVIGSAVAYNLLTRDPGLSVMVVERDPTYRTASSALSASSIRQQFSTPVNIAMSSYGMAFFKEIGEHLTVDDEVPDVGLVESGYLYLATEQGAAGLTSNVAIQNQEGADIALMRPAQIADRYPWISTEGLALGALGLSGEGWFDGYSLLQAFRRKARSLGARYVKATAIGLERGRGGITAVALDTGERVACGKLVNAAGPQAGAVAALAGIELPVRPEKHCVFVFDCKETLLNCPLLVDTSGVYFRPEGRFFIGGTPPQADADTDDHSLDVDYALFDDVLWPALANRVPAFEAIKLVNAWAGHYEMNLFDHNAILGTFPDAPNFYFANGFSGRGMQHAAAAGRGVAELILYGEYRSLDLSPLNFDRLLRNEPIRELNVI